MNWETFYDRFFDWSESTQISRISSLTSFGSSSEVAEVAQEFMDERISSRFVRKAIAAGVQFTPEEIYELSDCCDTATMNLLLETAQCAFTQEQLEDLDGIVDENVLLEAARRNRVTLFDDDETMDTDDFVTEEEPPQKLGFFTALVLLLGIGGLTDKRKKRGCGNGDCANAPPHYGYRYGRWYYGHRHTSGCEFGGNE